MKSTMLFLAALCVLIPVYEVSAKEVAGKRGKPTRPGDGPDCGYGVRPKKARGLRVWITGSAADACASPTGPGVLLMGGGTDVDDAFSNRVRPRIDGGDAVVLRTSGSNGYNDYLDPLVQSDSVETLLVDSRSKANSTYVDWVVRSAEFVFIAGGDQSDYLNTWQGTALANALQHVYDKGGIIGGTSAGNAVQGELIYDPDGVPGAYSSEAVSDACHPYIQLSNRLLDAPLMDGVITDTHFYERNRLGRLIAFMAVADAHGISPTMTNPLGVGVDEATALFIDYDGFARVDGDGYVYVNRFDSQTILSQVQCGAPVRVFDVLSVRLGDGDYYDFADQSHNGSALGVDVDGASCAIDFTEQESCFYTPANPY